MTRWKAAGIHLAISAVAVAAIGIAIVVLWYPPALFEMAKAGRLMALIGGIDVVVGPLVTLIIYKHGKRHLKLDLAIIALLQAAFMGYGLNVMWQSRPVFLVAVPDRFELVFANDLEPRALAEADERYRRLSWNGPRLVGATLPLDLDEQMDITMSALAGSDLQTLPRYYVDYGLVAPSMAGRGLPLDTAAEHHPEIASALENAARKLGREPDQVRYLPLASRRGSASLLLDARTGEVLGPVAVDPWAR